MKTFTPILLLIILNAVNSMAQIPVAKRDTTKKTLEQKINGELPSFINVGLPKASGSLPGNTKINNSSDAKKFVSETLPDLGLKISKKVKKIKKDLKGMKKEFNGKDYEGIAVEKHLIRQGSGSRLTFTEFYTLKEYQQPSPYLRHIFWYDRKTDRVIDALARDRETNQVMHGPYKKYLGEDLIEEGYYYVGAKDGRWVRYDKDFNLLDKEKYDRGFLAESKITYFDDKQTKIKEVTPKLYGKVSGEYYAFNESGTLAEQGMMDDSVKVGTWIEYFPLGNKRKKEMQYGKDCFDKKFVPFLQREYDEKGKLIFEAKK